MAENNAHTWQKVYVIQRMAGRAPSEDRKVFVPGEQWSAFFGLRDDGRVFYSPFHSVETHAVAESMFRRGDHGWLSDSYCDRAGIGSGWVTNAVGFTEHCAALAATSPRDETGKCNMYERDDLEGEQEVGDAV